MMSVREIHIPDVMLSLEEQVELGKRMANGDSAAREKLVLSCVPLVKSFWKTPLCQCYSLADEVFQDGMMGVLEVVDKYDYTRNVKFTTFAFIYIHKNILKGIIKRAPLKISDEDFFHSALLRSTIDTFCAAHQFPPTNEQLSKLTAIPLKDVEFLLRRNINKMSISLEKNPDLRSDIILPEHDVTLAVEKTLRHSFQKKLIADALYSLNENEREIIQKRFLYKDRKTTLRELSIAQNISIEMVRKREEAALKKLFAFFIEHNVSFEDALL